MMEDDNQKFNLRKYLKDEDLYEKNRLRLAKLVFRVDGFSREEYREIVGRYLRGNEDSVDIDGLTDEVYKFYRKSVERHKRMQNMDFVIPSANKGFETLYKDYHERNFGGEN